MMRDSSGSSECFSFRCAVLNGISLGESVSVSCDVEGRYVNVFLPGTDKTLTLCEVEVYEAGTVSLHKITSVYVY